MPTDPVCKMEVLQADQAVATREFEGETFYFDSRGCANMFDKDPARYAATLRPVRRATG